MIDFKVSDSKVAFSLGDSEKLSFFIDNKQTDFKTAEKNDISFVTESIDTDFIPDLKYGSGSSPVPTYQGAYTVTPKTSQQVLNTAGYKMIDNVTVKKITYAETSNIYGTTAWIGEE